jgi:hypothetical protein
MEGISVCPLDMQLVIIKFSLQGFAIQMTSITVQTKLKCSKLNIFIDTSLRQMAVENM